MKKILLAILCCFSINSYAVVIDSAIIDSISTVKGFPSTRIRNVLPYSIPAVMVSYGFMSLRNKMIQRADMRIEHEMIEDFSHFSTNIDDKLQFAPAVGVYALNFLGIEGKNNMVDRSLIYISSVTIMANTVNYLKTKTHKMRPSGSDKRSFPSGHTATAFVAAEFIRQEYKDLSPWYGIAGYSIAASTGALRVIKNVHWFSDVIAGAGIGILSTKITYIAYPWIKNKVLKSRVQNIQLMPTLQSGKAGFSFRYAL